MPQLDQLSACPGCGEPLEEDDRFCGVCGTDLRTAARSPGAPSPNGTQERPPGYTPTEHDFHLPPPLQSPPHPDRAERQPPPAGPAAAPAPAHPGPAAAAAPPPPPAP
ncbi:zinc-ribbon domain-containing protein, partial [Streptomyces triticirhizae]